MATTGCKTLRRARPFAARFKIRARAGYLYGQLVAFRDGTRKSSQVTRTTQANMARKLVLCATSSLLTAGAGPAVGWSPHAGSDDEEGHQISPVSRTANGVPVY